LKSSTLDQKFNELPDSSSYRESPEGTIFIHDLSEIVLVVDPSGCLVFTDFKMSGMNGLALLRRVHAMDARTLGVLVTGFRENLPRGVAGDPAIFALLYKPYKGVALRAMVRDAARCAAMARSSDSLNPTSRRLTSEPARKSHAK
jgi:DNA-binding LytR/AlgR family response regulator